jgi:hypothetical protein
MPTYVAGWVNGGNATIRFGTGFSVERIGATGGYRLTLPATASGAMLATVVTPSGPDRVGRISQVQQNADGSLLVDVEIRTSSTGALINGDFHFIALEAS